MAERKFPKEVIDYIIHLRKIYSDLRKIYMFGSVARGRAGRDSDIDLAMVFDDVADTFDRQVQLMKFRRMCDSRIEPHVFRLNDFDEIHPIAREIIETGIEVSESFRE